MKSKFFMLLNLLLLPLSLVFAQHPAPFLSNWTMTFPSDVVVTCGNEDAIPPALSKQQIINNHGDDVWGMEVEEDIFDISGLDGNGACYKIIRTYIFVNWDTWSINNTELGIVNRPHDLILSDADRVILRHQSVNLGLNIFGDEDDADPYDEQISTEDDGALIILEDVSPSDGDLFPRSFVENINGNFVTSGYAENYGYFAYRQIIKVADHDAPIISALEDLSFCDTIGTCDADVFLPPPTVIECSNQYHVFYTVTNTLTGSVYTNGMFPGDAPFDTIFIDNVPFGNYHVNYRVTDGCGNVSATSYAFKTEDCLAPTAYCINGLAVNLDQNGTVTLWANDFDAGSFDACTEPINLSFSQDLSETSISFECLNLGVNIVRLYATDALGNAAYCSTFVVVQANTNSECDTSVLDPIAGAIQTELGDPVANVRVAMNNVGGMDTLMTTMEGTYTPTEIYLGYDYTFSPQKNTNHSNGISVYDLILLRKHVLNIELLDSPYKMIAADVNRNNSITTGDIVELTKILIGHQNSFENNTAWRFVDSQYTFPDADNPWSEFFPEVINYNNLTDEESHFDFIGVKVGDLNISANTGNLVIPENRNPAKTLQLQAEDLSLKTGKTYRIPISATELSEIEGFQATLDFATEDLELLDIQAGLIEATQWNMNLGKQGHLPFIYLGQNNSDAPLFYLTVRAKTNALLSDVLSLNTDAIAYHQQDDALNMALNFKTTTLSSDVELYQNKPNPFSDYTEISFFLPEDATVQLTVYNAQQQIIFQNKPNLSAGYHVLPFEVNALPSGVYYYSLKVNKQVFSRRMVVL